jgi:hypothetical protein
MTDPSSTNDDENGDSQSHRDVKGQVNALNRIIDALEQISNDARAQVLQTAATFFSLDFATSRGRVGPQPSASSGSGGIAGSNLFSEDRTPSPKEFMLSKRPSTDIERMACLAYYQTHYRNVPHFKTLDLSKLNTEAAQIKFSNAAVAVENAAKTGLLVPASKGTKQISSMGEQYVQALPDRDAAKKTLAEFRRRRKTRRGRSDSSANQDSSSDDSNSSS